MHEEKTLSAGSLSIAKQCIVGLSAFTAGYKPSFVMEIPSSGRDGLEELPPFPRLADISHLCPSIVPQRNDNGGRVLSRLLTICKGGRVVGFHFHLATLCEAKVGTNELCWSVCSCSGAHKLTLFIDPVPNSAPICGNGSLSLLNKCCYRG